MKNFKLVALFAFAALTLFSCTTEETTPKNDESNIPSTYQGRDVTEAGTINITNREISISVWDHGQIDGDIVSIVVNGNVVIDEYELKGPDYKKTVDVTLKYDGYNYVLLYAHNTGDLYPNTCSIEINDGDDAQTFSLSADLDANSAYNLVVE